MTFGPVWPTSGLLFVTLGLILEVTSESLSRDWEPRVWKPETPGFPEIATLPPGRPRTPPSCMECMGVHSTVERCAGASFGSRDGGFWGGTGGNLWKPGVSKPGFRNLRTFSLYPPFFYHINTSKQLLLGVKSLCLSCETKTSEFSRFLADF